MKYLAIAGLLALSFLAFLPAGPAHAQASSAPPAAVYQSAPFTGGQYFATAKCVTQRFACSPALSRDQMTSVANICAEETFGVSNLMGEIGTAKNGYRGCALPTNFVSDPSAPLKKKWTICCVAPAKTGNACTMDCHLYYNNN
jgi:hypothetical protein